MKPIASHRTALAVAAWLALLVAGGSLPGPAVPTLRAAPNVFEQRNIEAQALQAFRAVVSLWREELYFELYDYGMESTKARISREEFAQRMVELSWVPVGEPNPKFLRAEYQFRTMIYVKARINYRHKFNPGQGFYKDHTFLMLLENGTWRVDLVQLVRAPFA